MNNYNSHNQLSENFDREKCSVCRDLLINIENFFAVLENFCKSSKTNWLTVEDIAKELKISKTVVYRLIRNCQLEAVNVVENNGKIAQKGHYRISKNSLNKYIETHKVKPLPEKPTYQHRTRNWPKVKNHLGL